MVSLIVFDSICSRDLIRIFKFSKIVHRIIPLKVLNYPDLPGQGLIILLVCGCTPQFLISVYGPLQSSPPCCGGGFVQVRVLCCFPFPHESEQDEYFDHEVNPPLTAKIQ